MDLLEPGIEPVSLVSPALAGRFFNLLLLGLFYFAMEANCFCYKKKNNIIILSWTFSARCLFSVFWIYLGFYLLKLRCNVTANVKKIVCTVGKKYMK